MTKRTALIGFTVITLLAMGVHYAFKVLQAFQFKVTGYGVPSFNNWILKVPITVQFDNPAGFAINADNLLIDAYLKTSGQYVRMGTVSQAVTLPLGKSTQTFIPVMNLAALGGSIVDSWAQMLAAKKIDLRTDITVTYQGVKLPKYQFEDQVKIL